MAGLPHSTSALSTISFWLVVARGYDRSGFLWLPVARSRRAYYFFPIKYLINYLSRVPRARGCDRDAFTESRQ